MKDYQQAEGTQEASSPVVVWEQSQQATSSSNVVSIDSYRKQAAGTPDSEAVVIARNLRSSEAEQPIRLIVVSSGFGQKAFSSSPSIQNKAAA